MDTSNMNLTDQEWPHRRIYKEPVKLTVLSLQLISSTGIRYPRLDVSTAESKMKEHPLSGSFYYSLLTLRVLHITSVHNLKGNTILNYRVNEAYVFE